MPDYCYYIICQPVVAESYTRLLLLQTAAATILNASLLQLHRTCQTTVAKSNASLLLLHLFLLRPAPTMPCITLVYSRYDLYTGWSPWNELSEFSFSDSLQALVYLGWVHFTLYTS